MVWPEVVLTLKTVRTVSLILKLLNNILKETNSMEYERVQAKYLKKKVFAAKL